METINTIDLWTEQHNNHYECFNGAFTDGFSNNKIPFDSYKIVKNCNCEITCNDKNIAISNKHNAVVFYKNKIPVRLLVANKGTDIGKCVSDVLEMQYNGMSIGNLFDKHNINSGVIDLNERPIIRYYSKETDVGSCDRLGLAESMLDGSYTEDDSEIGNDYLKSYEFSKDFNLVYKLKTDTESFEIEHNSAFISDDKKKIIPVQTESQLGQAITNDYARVR